MNEGSFLFCRVLFLFGAFVRPFCLCSIGLVSDLPMKKQKEQLIVNKLRYSRVTYRYMYFIFQSASSTSAKQHKISNGSGTRIFTPGARQSESREK